jgi:CheY-like chemotaxis protein
MERERPYILAVGGDADAADMAVFLLREWGFDAEAHHDGASALEAARFGPRAVLLVGVPEADALWFARLLRGQPRCGDSVVIAIGGHEAAAGADYYLADPVGPARLRELLDRAVRQPGLVSAGAGQVPWSQPRWRA